MESLGTIPSISLLFLISLQSVGAFNVDVTVPIVKEGNPNSYFGYSVAQHHINGEGRPGDKERVILVGAPLDNITHSSASQKERNLVKPGVIYSCPVSSSKSDCIELRINEPSRGAEKNGKWLGVSVASQGTDEGKAVACAHRYTQAGQSHRWGQGICTIMMNSLDEDQILEPCKPLDVSTGHSAYGMCQAGTSVDVSGDGDVLLGLPGPFNWRGAIFKNILEQTFEEDFQFYTSPVQNPSKPPAVPVPDPVPQEFDSYLGMSTAIGNLLGGEKTYIGGAPHSAGVGQVLLFTQGGTENTYLEIQQTLTGDQFGANFGYSLEVLDLNNDRKQDLVVGAPLYHAAGRGGAIYIYMNGDDGITDKTEPIKLLSPKMSQKECDALDCQNGQFGLSLAALGDLDRDGFDDLAVGAPFEGDGAVYIFRGSSNGLIQEYSQRIQSSSESLLLARPMKTFGSSLKGGMDMDDNGYPDLVVGAFEYNKALILRTRPVIDVTTGYEVEPKEIDPSLKTCDKTNKNANCFSVRICFKFTAEPKDRFTSPIKLVYKIQAESSRKVPRVYFKGADKTNQHEVERVIELNRQTDTEPSCDSHLLYLIKNNRDFLKAVQLQMTYKLEDTTPPVMTPGDPLPDINSYPVLDEAKAVVDIAVPFKKNCGDDDVCQSQLSLKGSIPKLDKDEADGHLILKVGHIDSLQVVAVVKNQGDDAHEASLNIVLPAKLYFVSAIKIVEKDNKKEERRITCTRQGEQNTWTCPVGNPMKGPDTETPVSKAVFKLNLDPNNINTDEKLLEIGMRVNTTSKEMDTNDDFVKLIMKVIVETDVAVTGFSDPPDAIYGGEIIGESAVEYEDEIGMVVNHTYKITNGPGFVNNVTVYISWPYQVENGRTIGKNLLYLMEEPLIEAPGKCFISPRYVNPLDAQPREAPEPPAPTPAPGEINAAVAEPQPRRVKREKVIKAEDVKDPATGKVESVVILDCDRGTARCFTFHCVISPFEADKQIDIVMRARLWNSTFLEDYRNVDHVKIRSKGRIQIDPKLNIRQNNTANDIYKVETKAVPDLAVEKQPGIATWVIVVAAVAGLLLLIILIVVLWKLGFFKRKRAGDIPDHKGTLQKKKKGKNSYYDDPYN